MTTAGHTSSFAFLAPYGPLYLQLATVAESALALDPSLTLLKLRQLAEAFAQRAASSAGLAEVGRDTNQHDLLRMLEQRGIVTDHIAEVFHMLRRAGNRAAHDFVCTHQDALNALGLLAIGPDEWQVERVSLAADPDDDQDEPTETKQLQHEFWTLTRAALDATGKFKSLQAARPRFWFDVAIGRSGAWISLNAGVAHGRLAVKLTFDEEGAAEMLPGFEVVRADIEREIGSPLEWNPHPEKKFKTIRISRPFSFADRAAWDGGIRWLTTTAVAFKQAFAPRVAST